jgi:hypothetical protein
VIVLLGLQPGASKVTLDSRTLSGAAIIGDTIRMDVIDYAVETLGRALANFRKQKAADLEVIVLSDDGSRLLLSSLFSPLTAYLVLF